MTEAVEKAYPGIPTARASSPSILPAAPLTATSASSSSATPARATPHSSRSPTSLIEVASRPEVKFVAVSSDVIYPDGAMEDYEFKFYLPFHGVKKPIYAIPGNHDWYNQLDSFCANFMEPARRPRLDARPHRRRPRLHRHHRQPDRDLHRAGRRSAPRVPRSLTASSAPRSSRSTIPASPSSPWIPA